MAYNMNPNYPSIEDIRKRAKSRVLTFAFEYLDGGCNEDVDIKRNTKDIHKVERQPRYLWNQRAKIHKNQGAQV